MDRKISLRKNKYFKNVNQLIESKNEFLFVSYTWITIRFDKNKLENSEYFQNS